MFDFDSLFTDLSNVETCNVIDNFVVKKMPYDFYKNGHVWEVKTEITFEGASRDICLYLNFPEDFPQDFPKIFINAEDYSKLKYIPHVDQDHLVCIFDKGRNLVMPKTGLSDFIQFMVSKAKKIISDASNQEYRTWEFNREFKAYWELKYSSDDKIQSSGIFSISGNGEINAVKFSSVFFGYEYFLYDDKNDLKKIEAVAELHGIRCEETAILIIDKEFKEPPFDFTAIQTLDIIKENESDYTTFKHLLSSFSFSHTLVVFRNHTGQTDEYYGWSYKYFEMMPRKISGVRNPASKIEYLKNAVVGKQQVYRLTFENLSIERLQKRTTGYTEDQKSIIITGLGSVGSNLLFWLKNLAINKFRLIDTDSLSVENIKRHFLGFSEMAQQKALALENQLKRHYPLVEVASKSESIKNVIRDTPEFINECDFHFVAIGSTMLEEYILNNIEKKVLTTPTLILWVEPYLASGQMLFIMPQDADKAKKLIVDDYRFAVLRNVEHQRNKTYLIEGSCQTGYFPYSGSNLVHFLSAIFPAIRRHIADGEQISKVYTWVGDKNLLASEQLELTDFGNANDSFSLIENLI
jgi:hypothetical protein